MAEVVGIRDCRRLRLRHLSDPHPGSSGSARRSVVLIIGALLARGYRTGFIAALGITATIIAINWSVFTSTDREAGGVGSVGEVEDRLNIHPDRALGCRTETHRRLGHRPVPGRQHLPPSAVVPGHAMDPWLWRRLARKRAGDSGRVGR